VSTNWPLLLVAVAPKETPEIVHFGVGVQKRRALCTLTNDLAKIFDSPWVSYDHYQSFAASPDGMY
jgi:hypothetical protein